MTTSTKLVMDTQYVVSTTVTSLTTVINNAFINNIYIYKWQHLVSWYGHAHMYWVQQ